MAITWTRQSDIFDPELFNNYGVTVVGCGAIGSGFTEAAVRMGMKTFTLIDDDIVDEHNLPNQLYNYEQLGRQKANALREKLSRINPDVKITPIMERFTPGTKITNPIVIFATDNMEARKNIFDECKKNKDVKLVIDGRMGGLVFTIYTIDMTSKKSIEFYEKNLFPDSEAKEDRCTAKSIIYNVFGVAAEMCSQLNKMFYNLPYFMEIIYDYKTNMRFNNGKVTPKDSQNSDNKDISGDISVKNPKKDVDNVKENKTPQNASNTENIEDKKNA